MLWPAVRLAALGNGSCRSGNASGRELNQLDRRRHLTESELVMYLSTMAIGERTLSYMLRNSGAVLDEVEQRDIVLQRRDGEDL